MNANKQLQDALDYACALGRWEAGHDPLFKFAVRQLPEKELEYNPVHINGDGFEGVRRDAFLQTFSECGGSMGKVVKRLRISRQTAYDWKNRFIAGCLLFCACAFGAATDPIVTPAVEPKAPPITLAWDESPDAVSGYRIYWGTNSGVYISSVTVGDTTNAAISGLIAGRKYYFAATAFNQTGESGFSNEINATATAGQFIAVISRTAATPTGPWTNGATVWSGNTNLGNALYFSHAIIRSNYTTWK